VVRHSVVVEAAVAVEVEEAAAAAAVVEGVDEWILLVSVFV
jgi:hypothetical protein